MNEQEIRLLEKVKRRYENAIELKITGFTLFEKHCGQKKIKAKILWEDEGCNKHKIKPVWGKASFCSCPDCNVFWYQ